VSDRHPSAWAEAANQRLAEAGYRRGGARREVVALLGEQHCALSAAQIEDALRSRDRAVSRASVYRVLEELEQIGIVQRVGVGQGMVRYEPIGPSHHHHLVCDRCGRLEPFADDGLERAIARLSERVSFHVDEHEVVLRGACEACEEG
jgi:Fur family ferric uptake transcriptional regulator